MNNFDPNDHQGRSEKQVETTEKLVMGSITLLIIAIAIFIVTRAADLI